MTPADEIKAAAEKLRVLVTAATSGPWSETGIGDYGWTVSSPTGALFETADSDQGLGDAAFIAAMHPGVGAALADWLDRMADAWTQANGWTVDVVATLLIDALTVARAINGSPS